MNKLTKYMDQDIDNPTYLFHGSPKKLDIILPNVSHDSNNNVENIDNAIFLFPSFIKATPYAFKDTIKSMSNNMEWSFNISNNNEYPLMTMKNVNIDENIIGYIYVFNKDDNMIKDKNSYQYKCYKELIPIDTICVRYKDYKKYYSINKK